VKVVGFLVDEGLVQWRTSAGISITHSGVVSVEASLEAGPQKEQVGSGLTHMFQGRRSRWVLGAVATALVADIVNWAVGFAITRSQSVPPLSSSAWSAFLARVFGGTIMIPFVYVILRLESRKPNRVKVVYSVALGYVLIFGIAFVLDLISGRLWPFFFQ